MHTYSCAGRGSEWLQARRRMEYWTEDSGLVPKARPSFLRKQESI
jgi:hypothetical protein